MCARNAKLASSCFSHRMCDLLLYYYYTYHGKHVLASLSRFCIRNYKHYLMYARLPRGQPSMDGFKTHYDHSCKTLFNLSSPTGVIQKGLIRRPEPKGENGFTLAHITASLIEMADRPSSRKYTGPYKEILTCIKSP